MFKKAGLAKNLIQQEREGLVCEVNCTHFSGRNECSFFNWKDYPSTTSFSNLIFKIRHDLRACIKHPLIT